MRITDIFHEPLYDKDRLTITFDKKDRQQIQEKLEALGTIDSKKEYDLEIKKRREKRSLDANGYMWALVEQIAVATGEKKEDVYRHAIRNVGVFADIAIQNKAERAIVKSWSEKGIGWFTESFDSKLRGCRRVRLYFGSSTYNTKEMSRLIDDIVDEARNLHIETKTPNEIKRLKEAWKGDDYE